MADGIMETSFSKDREWRRRRRFWRVI